MKFIHEDLLGKTHREVGVTAKTSKDREGESFSPARRQEAVLQLRVEHCEKINEGH
jgi:hypothetical protein